MYQYTQEKKVAEEYKNEEIVVEVVNALKRKWDFVTLERWDGWNKEESEGEDKYPLTDYDISKISRVHYLFPKRCYSYKTDRMT